MEISKDDSLFPEETDMYDSYVIREALHNCIAHQDYTLGGHPIVVEFPDKLIFKMRGYRGNEWMDGKNKKLEDQLPRILATIELRVHE